MSLLVAMFDACTEQTSDTFSTHQTPSNSFSVLGTVFRSNSPIAASDIFSLVGEPHSVGCRSHPFLGTDSMPAIYGNRIAGLKILQSQNNAFTCSNEKNQCMQCFNICI